MATQKKVTTTKTKETGTNERVITRVVERFNMRSKKDIKDWRRALDTAESLMRPNRTLYYNLCDEVELDPHLTGVIEHGRRDKLFAQEFRVVDEEGNIDPVLTEFFRGKWFFDLCEFILASNFYGHSLIQVGDIVDINGQQTITDIQLIPRRHVRPEYGEILTDQSDERGYPYRNDATMMYWLIEVGRPKELGLFKKAAPIVLFKKNAIAAWSEYTEIFGMPMRVAETTSRDSKDLDRLQDALDRMGKSATAVLNAGETFKFIESTKGDAFQVYDKLIDRCNSELSKLILGSTLTTDTGANGNRSLGDVHMEGTNNVMESDKRLIASVVKDQLMTLLEQRGLKVQGRKFEYSEQKDLGELYERVEGLLQHFEVDEQFINDTFGIPVKKKTASVEQTPEPPTGEKKKPQTLSVNHSWVDELYKECICGDTHQVRLAITKQNNLDKAATELAELCFNEEVTFGVDVFQAMNDILIDALVAGWMDEKKLKLSYRNTVDLKIDYSSPDWQTIANMEANLFRFSAAKTLTLVNELNGLAKDNKTFEEFKKKATPLLDSYTVNTLRTEYNFAWQTAQNAAEYNRMQAEKEVYPYWQYITAGDSRVRAAHKALDKMVFRADDPAWDTIYPPNGWGCRCYVKPLMSYSESKLSTKEKALDALASTEIDSQGNSELDRMRKNGMDINRAKLGEVFTANQMYKQELNANLGIKDNGLQPYKDMSQKDWPNLPVVNKTKEEAKEWYAQNVKDERIIDYAGRPIEFTAKTVDRHLKEDKLQEGRQNILELVPEVIQSPDEVFFQPKSDKTQQYAYIKYYKQGALFVPVQLKDGKLVAKSWFNLDREPDDRRTGFVLKK
jgi:SPP1 gp7 family putative phage head morphogenesis protein